MAKKLQRRVAKPGPAASPELGAPAAGARSKGRRVASQAVTEFTVQLSTLSASGIPMVRGLSILEGQARPGPFKDVLGDLVEDVSSGTPLSEAMEKHGRAFDRLYSAMVRAGETGGVLDKVLERLATYRERAAALRGKVINALVYPAIIVLVAVVVISAVIVWVIPRFQQIFDSFGVELPGLTQALLNLSSFAVHYWYAVFGVPAACLVLHVVLMGRPGGYRFFMHGLLLKIPLLGAILRLSLIAGFSRTFGTLLQAGVPHLDALGIVRDTSANDVLSEAVESIRKVVREGEGISRPMEETGAFDDMVCNMVDVGEQTGELDRMLLRVADTYEAKVERDIDRFFKWLEPALLVVMAVFVGLIVMALFLPLMKIMSTLSQP
ncbi:MAG: type II secretion system F family protein [Planctomycetes bacterium]|nr:type II secretion system F family protein [Planctomycetota bacterium]